MQKVTMQMLTPKQWRATMEAAKILWSTGDTENYYKGFFKERQQAEFNNFLARYECKKELIEVLILLGLYSYDN